MPEGLHPEVRSAASEVLSDCLRIWRGLEPKDRRELAEAIPQEQPSGMKGWTYKYTVRTVKAQTAQAELAAAIPNLPSLTRLANAIEKHQPHFPRAFVLPSVSINGIGLEGVVTHWAQQLTAEDPDGSGLAQPPDTLLNDFDQVLRTKRLTYAATYTLAGLTVHEGYCSPVFGTGWVIRHVRRNECSQLNETRLKGDPFTVKHVAVLEYTQQVDVSFPDVFPCEIPPFALGNQLRLQAQQIVDVLHLVKSAQIQIVRTGGQYLPTILPGMLDWVGSTDRAGNKWVEFNDPDWNRFADRYSRVISAHKNEIDLALTRLGAAELRSATADQVIDAFVGIEALLNPPDHSEISFTTSLAYAVLGEQPERLRRFELMSSLYRLRSRIVHGAEVEVSWRDGVNAIECLRDILNTVLSEDDFIFGRSRHGKRYWAERLLRG